MATATASAASAAAAGGNASRAERKAKKERATQARMAAALATDELPSSRVTDAERVDRILADGVADGDEALPQGDDIHVHKFTIYMGGKALFKDATLTLARGHRYGLVGPPAPPHPR
jgi:hypothetical protein